MAKKATKKGRAPGAKTAAASPARAASYSRWWAPAVIVLAGLLTYANSLNNPFVLDDVGSIAGNVGIRDLTSWQVLTPPANTPTSGRPLVNLSLAINYAFGGTNVWGYHAVNLALHVACGLLVLAVASRLLALGPALAIAVLWVVHPLNSEVVNYLTQRTESLMALFLLITLFAATRGGEHRRRWEAAAVGACAAGMACKETMVVAPLAVLLFDSVYVFGSAAAAIRARSRFYLSLAATWLLLALLVATGGQSLTGGFPFAPSITPWTYLMNQAVLITEYFRLAVWPDSLVAFHGWAAPLTLADVWPRFVLIAALFLGALVALWRWPKVGAPAVWVFLTLGPMSSVLPIVAEVGAERRMYLPLIGLVTLAVLAGVWLWARAGALRVRARWLPAAAVAGVAIALSVTSMARNREYASRLSLIQTVVDRWPTPNARQLLGSELAALGRHDEAIAHLRIAAEGFPMALYYLGEALVRAKRPAEAIGPLEEFLPIAPTLSIRNTHLLLADAYSTTGQATRALDHLKAVLAITPDDGAVHALLADALAGRQAFGEAIPHYQAFLAGSPQNARAATGLGVALVATGRGAEAVAAFGTAVEAEPTNARYRQNLARALGDHGDAHDALRHAQEAVTLDAKDPASFEVLGRALLRLGRTADARISFRRALQIDPTYAPALDGLRAVSK